MDTQDEVFTPVTCGLRERIEQAASIEGVKQLLELGDTYHNASDKTRRAWDRTAAKRIRQLTEAK
jgi:hypothetical protein